MSPGQDRGEWLGWDTVPCRQNLLSQGSKLERKEITSRRAATEGCVAAFFAFVFSETGAVELSQVGKEEKPLRHEARP